MKFRYARHTDQLETILNFYTEILPFKLLGKFENHSGYNGIFVGLDNSDWQLEFTDSEDKPVHSFDEDDALVFYLKNKEELEMYRNKLREQKVEILKAKNPYWNTYGALIKDPDGCGIILAYRPKS